MTVGSVLVVGAGLAGSRCAEALRARGFEGRLVVIGDEPAPPYSRPALSKEFLAGSHDAVELLLRPHGHWPRRGIELRLGQRVARVDVVRRTAVDGRGTIVAWDALVLATGARARRLPIGAPPGVYTLRTIADALLLRRALRSGSRLAIVGAGLIGTEVASTAHRLGVEVVLVAPQPPLHGIAGPRVGSLLSDRYRRAGVDVLCGTVAGFRAGHGRVIGVTLADGTEVRCDTVLVAVGANPATELLPGATRGIATDADGRTAFPGVFACGDAALAWRPALGQHVRLEHWTSAAEQADAVASAIIGREQPCGRTPPFFWSDQFGLRLQFIGKTGGAGGPVELEGGTDAFRVRYLDREGRLVGALLANRPAEVRRLRQELAA
jgi:NADPH-dependent 2,4-dienoyl-CoA reductase/sulfur reductase-like enzyme